MGFISAAPEPKNHIKTLMRIGYDFNSAIADILDNSITAESTEIDINVKFNETDPLLLISDNGHGMTEDELLENMKVSCKDPDESREIGDLGRFGSGMKTASFSHARKLTVISKNPKSKICGACWDIDEIETSNLWNLEVLSDKRIANELSRIDVKFIDKGTILIWDNITMFRSNDHIELHDQISSKLSELKQYLSLHFHKFMQGKNKIKFRIQGDQLNPQDPFLSSHTGSITLGEDNPLVDGKKVSIKLHILPHHDYLSAEELDAMGGVDEMYRKQGLYVYRSKRLIIAGGWMNLSRSFQLAKLARVEIDIPASLDKAWSTDVKKMTLQLPAKIKNKLKELIKQPIKKSKKEYEYRGKKEEVNDFWDVCENEKTNQIQYLIDKNNKRLKDIFLDIDDKKIQKKLKNFLNDLSKSLPLNNIYEKMSSDPKKVNQTDALFNIDIDAIFKEKLEEIKNG